MSAADTLPNWKGSVSEAETSDDGEPRLQIVETDTGVVDRRFERTTFGKTDDVTNASDAVESLLMLGRDIWSKSDNSPVNELAASKGRRFSSGDLVLSHDEKGVVTYYQKMRERNNEASKRCRLKRRMKAESLESQLNLLSMTNKMLKQRIARMETISGAIKDGISQIQTNNCNCLQTVATVQQVNRDFKDPADLSNTALLKTSKNYRDQNPELLLPPSSSDDDFSADLSSTNSPVPPVCGTAGHPPTSFSGFLVKMNSAPVLTKIPASVSVPGTPVTPSNPVYPRAKTALDIINDTIIKSLGSSSSTSSSYPSSPSPVPLNLVKILPSQPASQPSHLLTRQLSHGSMSGNSPMIVVAPTTPTTTLNVDIVKKEPESTTSSTTTAFTNGVDPVESCVAAASDGHCRGPLHIINKLTSYLNAVTGYPVSTDDGSAAMERAIIKSRLRIPFWKADEIPSFICDAHRHAIVRRRDDADIECAICGKKKAKKVKSVMFTVTYRISLENHIKNGSILPIGHLVCAACKDKHLKGIDTTSSQIVSNDNNVTMSVSSASSTAASISIRPSVSLKRPASIDSSSEAIPNHLPIKIRPSPPCFSSARNSTEVQVIIQPVQKESTPVPPISMAPAGSQPPPPPSGSGGRPMDNIFSKISRLNEALHSINPKYKPIGFSITSIESCSSSILQDAIVATETAVSTLMSVIAPGQESFLWESIKPLLDKKMLCNNPINHNNNNNNNNKSL